MVVRVAVVMLAIVVAILAVMLMHTRAQVTRLNDTNPSASTIQNCADAFNRHAATLPECTKAGIP